MLSGLTYTLAITLLCCRLVIFSFCLTMSAANGLFMSGVFALVATDAARYFPEKSGAVFGIFTAGVGIGAMLFPAVLMGTVALVYALPRSR